MVDPETAFLVTSDFWALRHSKYLLMSHALMVSIGRSSKYFKGKFALVWSDLADFLEGVISLWYLFMN